jgi:hypothetical protein
MVARRRGIEVVLLVAALALGASSMAVAPAAEAAAPSTRQKEMQARRAFAAGEWKEALALFADLYAQTLHPVYLRNIGRCHQKLRDPDRAIDAFRDYLAKNKQVSGDERVEIEGYIKEMEGLRADTASRARADAAAVKPADTAAASPTSTASPGPDLTPRPPPPGPSLVATGPEPAPAAAPVYKRWWFWTGIGVAVAGGVVAALALNRGGGDDCPSGVTCK